MVKASRRTVLCKINETGQMVNVYCPGAGYMDWAANRAGLVLIHPYEVARPSTSHFLLSGDARVFLPEDYRDSEFWCGFSTSFNNKIMQKVLQMNLWPSSHKFFRKEVKVGDSRIDFKVDQTYVEVKAQYALHMCKAGSRMFKHLTLLNELGGEVVLVTASAEPMDLGREEINLIRQFSHITFRWLCVEYDKKGFVYFKGWKKLSEVQGYANKKT